MKKPFFIFLGWAAFLLHGAAASADEKGNSVANQEVPPRIEELLDLEIKESDGTKSVAAPILSHGFKECLQKPLARTRHGNVDAEEAKRYFYEADYIHLVPYGGLSGISGVEFCGMASDILKKELKVPVKVLGCQDGSIEKAPHVISACTINVTLHLAATVRPMNIKEDDFSSIGYYSVSIFRDRPHTDPDWWINGHVSSFPIMGVFHYKEGDEKLREDLYLSLNYSLREFISDINKNNLNRGQRSQ